MDKDTTAEAATAVIRRNTAEVQGRGDFAAFEALFADDYVDHTPQRGGGGDSPPFIKRLLR